MRVIHESFFSLINKHLKDYPSPKNLGYFWNFGSLLGIALTIQIISGIFLAMYYTPHINLAFLSVEYIVRDVQGGWFLRYLHSNTASFYFFFLYLHIFKALFYKSYNLQNLVLWCSGIIIFFLSAATAFLGYVLPWGQMSLWGATVITNLITAIPIVGKIVVTWIWGGFSISNATLNRFFIIHMVLPFAILGLVLSHILILHEKGSSSPLGTFLVTDKIAFFPYYVYKDLFGLFCFFIILNLFLCFSPNFLVGHPDNYIAANSLVTPLHIVPEWYFLPYYAILRSIPNKLGGVLAMGGAMAIFFFKGFIDYSLPQSLYFRPLLDILFGFFILVFVCLKILGGLPIEDPFETSSQILAYFYFFYIIFLSFLISEQEVRFYKFLSRKLFINNKIV